jgi:hypothetical protein
MPAGNTYEAIATQTLGSAAASVTFSSIPSTYTDLVLIISGRVSATSGNNVSGLVFNGDSASNYSMTRLTGDGSSAASDRTATSYAGWCFIANSTSSELTPVIYNIQNYSNTTTHKTTIGRGSAASSLVSAVVSTWRNTAAINSIQVVQSSTTWVANSTFSLYGIASA